MEKTELEDFLADVEPINELRKIIVGVLLILVFILITVIRLPHPGYIAMVIFLLTIWFFSSYVFSFLVKKQQTVLGASNLYLGYLLLELLILTFIVYYLGGVEWIGAIFYLLVIVYANITLSRSRGLVISSTASILYTSLVLLEYHDLVIFKEFLLLYRPGSIPLEESIVLIHPHQDPAYIVATLFAVIFAFYLVGFASNIFTDVLRKRTEELKHARKELKASEERYKDLVKSLTKIWLKVKKEEKE